MAERFHDSSDLSAIQDYISTQRQYPSDVRILCQGFCFRAHSTIIGAHSAYLRRMCTHDFERLGNLEIRLDDEPLIAVEAMMAYLYTLRYEWPERYSRHLRPERPTYGSVSFSPGLVHARVFVLASKFGIAHLGDLAVARFKADMNARALKFITAPNLACAASFITTHEFRALSKYVYDNTFPPFSRLRHCLVDCLLSEKERITGWGHFDVCAEWRSKWQRDNFDQLLATTPDLAIELKIAVSGRTGYEPQNLTQDHIWMAFLSGSATVERVLAVEGDPPADLYLDAEAEDWKSECADPEVVGMMEHPEYDVRDEAQGSDDPPRDLYLRAEALEWELEDVAGEVMDMIYFA